MTNATQLKTRKTQKLRDATPGRTRSVNSLLQALPVLCVRVQYYYLAGCTTFPHLPLPIEHLQYLLSPFVSVIPVFFH